MKINRPIVRQTSRDASPRLPVSPFPRHPSSGQATVEIILLFPLFILMAGIAISFAYISWQGIKVQQAANLAARMQGQERIGGGTSSENINQENGITGAGDEAPDPDSGQIENLISNPASLAGLKARGAPTDGVYGRFYKAVYDMFSPGEQEKLFVPPPDQGINSDRVRVFRVLRPPKILNFQLDPIVLQASAYGGEDTRMYGLPRWGKTSGSSGAFFEGQFRDE